MATNVNSGQANDAQPIAADGFRTPKATNMQIPPPTMNTKNGVNCSSNEPLNDIMIRMHVAIPTSRKNTVPRLTATACRELA